VWEGAINNFVFVLRTSVGVCVSSPFCLGVRHDAVRQCQSMSLVHHLTCREGHVPVGARRAQKRKNNNKN
jgi:hypothetical protein